MTSVSLVIINLFYLPLNCVSGQRPYQGAGQQYKKVENRGFLGGAVVKNPPANAGETGLIPGPGRSHMPKSN